MCMYCFYLGNCMDIHIITFFLASIGPQRWKNLLKYYLNDAQGCNHAGFHSFKASGIQPNNCLILGHIKQLLGLVVCHWPWTKIYHEHNLSSWYGKEIHLVYSFEGQKDFYEYNQCIISLHFHLFVVLLDFSWIVFSRQMECVNISVATGALFSRVINQRMYSIGTSGWFH